MNILTKIVGPLVGLVIACFGGSLLVLEMQKAVVHSGRVYVFVGVFGLGCLIIIPSVIAGAMKQLVVVIGPYLPEVRIGGRRKGEAHYDPPDDPE